MPSINSASLLTSYYSTMVCAIVSFSSFMWALFQFNELANNVVQLHIEEIYWFFILVFVLSCLISTSRGREMLEKFIALPKCQMMTWKRLLAKLMINIEKGTEPISRSQLLGIAIGISIILSCIVILCTLPVNEYPEQEEYEEEPIPQELEETDTTSTPSDEDIICMAALRKYYTASYSQIDEWGGEKAFETERFMEYTSCWDCDILTSNQDFGIGDDCLRLESIEPNAKLEHSFIVTVSCGYSESIPTCVVMANIDGVWKIDNIAYKPYEEKYIDYSKPASAYYVYETCGEETPYDESELPFEVPKSEDEEAMPYNASEIIPEESEDFISL